MTEERKEIITEEQQIKCAELIKGVDMKTFVSSDPMRFVWLLEELAFQHGIDFVLDKVLDNIVPKESLKWHERMWFWLGRKGISAIIGNQFSKNWDETIDAITEVVDKLDDWATEKLNNKENNKYGRS